MKVLHIQKRNPRFECRPGQGNLHSMDLRRDLVEHERRDQAEHALGNKPRYLDVGVLLRDRLCRTGDRIQVPAQPFQMALFQRPLQRPGVVTLREEITAADNCKDVPRHRTYTYTDYGKCIFMDYLRVGAGGLTGAVGLGGAAGIVVGFVAHHRVRLIPATKLKIREATIHSQFTFLALSSKSRSRV